MCKSSDDFYNSSFSQMYQAVDMYIDEMGMKASAMEGSHYDSKYFNQKSEVKVNSMKEMRGLI